MRILELFPWMHVREDRDGRKRVWFFDEFEQGRRLRFKSFDQTKEEDLWEEKNDKALMDAVRTQLVGEDID